jgi:hypothetical protein
VTTTTTPPSAAPRVRLDVVARADADLSLPPAGCVAHGSAACGALISALLRLDDERLVRLRAVRAGAIVVVIGPADALPWFDGVRYLGEAASGLWIPTTRSLSVPAALALEPDDTSGGAAARSSSSSPSPPIIVPLALALPLTRTGLTRARGGA